jgi:ribosomal protein S12 methylthiotransferase
LLNIGMVSLGCSKNLVDSEIMLGQLSKEFNIVNNPAMAEVIIVNTCGFLEASIQESIDTIIEMAEFKKDKCKLLVVTGCMTERFKKDVLTEMPEIDIIAGVANYTQILSIIKKGLLSNSKSAYLNSLDDLNYLNNNRILSTGKNYAYLKIAEGCDNCCSYCMIPLIRGRFKSRKYEDILLEAKNLVMSGISEIILIAQDTTRYGSDLYGKFYLPELLDELSKISGLKRIRIMYCYPDEITDELIDIIATNEKICKYIDIPLQHVSDNILKNMNRRSTFKDTCKLIEKLRSKIPNICLRTTFIVGFPGETEEEFEELFSFVSKYKIDRLGVFVYSNEDGTISSKLPNLIPSAIGEERKNKILKLQSEISSQLNMNKIGICVEVLVEGIADDGIFYFGRSYADAPEVDGLIYFTHAYPLEIGKYVKVKIVDVYTEYDLIGVVEDEPSE